jgi:chromosome partitioning protein
MRRPTIRARERSRETPFGRFLPPPAPAFHENLLGSFPAGPPPPTGGLPQTGEERCLDARAASHPENWTSEFLAVSSPAMILTFAGQKGGAGKTTAAICTATEWLARGRKVLVVDADPQGSTRTWGEVAAEAGREAPTIVAMGAGLYRPDQLPALADQFDVVIIDCPPRHGEIQRAALMVADLAVLPCGPSALDVWALSDSLDLVNAARQLRPQLRAAVLITRKAPRTVLGAGVRSALAEVGLPVLAAELCLRVTYPEALAAGQGVTTYAKRTPAAAEVRALVSELEGLFAKEKEAHAA